MHTGLEWHSMFLKCRWVWLNLPVPLRETLKHKSTSDEVRVTCVQLLCQERQMGGVRTSFVASKMFFYYLICRYSTIKTLSIHLRNSQFLNYLDCINKLKWGQWSDFSLSTVLIQCCQWESNLYIQSIVGTCDVSISISRGEIEACGL